MSFSKKHWLLFYSLISLCIIFFYQDYTKIYSSYLQIHYLDIGQGDATLIITPENQKILIDTGPAGNLNQKMKKYFSFFDKKIDLFILTHPDDDHIGDIFNLVKGYQIQQIVLPKNTQNKTEFKQLLQHLKKHQTPILFAHHQTDLKIGNEILIDFLYPFQKSSIQEQNSFSNASLVFKILHHKNTFLFSGDAEKKQEKLIAQSSQNLKANIYQVGHHGSKSSSSPFFLQAIQPEIAIISAQKNNAFGHPHEEIIQRLINQKIQIQQTSLEHDISFYSNGKKYFQN